MDLLRDKLLVRQQPVLRSIYGKTSEPGKSDTSRRAITGEQARLIDEVTAASSSGASLSDVKHIVILMQENRSFDHYFGTMSGVRGFSDPKVPIQTVGGVKHPVFDQFGFKPGKGQRRRLPVLGPP